MDTSQTSDLIDENVAPIDDMKKQTILNKEHLARESMSTQWTDEKHSLYLKSMEASFVNDLYNSFDLLGYQVEHPSDPKLLRRKHNASLAPSGQFKVLQGGCWENINFERNRSRSEKLDSSGVLLANPWIRHIRSSRGRQTVASSRGRQTVASSCGRQTVASSTPKEKVSLAADISIYDSAEVTDQNFVDEENTGEKEIHTCYSKRVKTSMAPMASNDQVVPLDKFSGSADVTDKSCF